MKWEDLAAVHRAAAQVLFSAVRRLRQRREDADYRRGITVDRTSARESMRDVRQVFTILSPEAR